MPDNQEQLAKLLDQLTNPFLTEREVSLIERKIEVLKSLDA